MMLNKIFCFFIVLFIGFLAACTESTTTPVVEEMKPQLPPPTDAEQAILEEPCSDPEQAIRLYEKFQHHTGYGAMVYYSSVAFVHLNCFKDKETAKLWFIKAVDEGNEESAYNLGSIYLSQNNKTEAEKWYQTSGEMGDIAGAARAGELARERKDYKQAEKLYELALNNKSSDSPRSDKYGRYVASYQLGELNYHEFKNYEQAYWYYDEAQQIPNRYNHWPTERTSQAFYGSLNAQVMGRFMEETEYRFSFDDQMTYIQTDYEKGFALANKEDLLALAYNLQRNGYDIRAMGIYYTLIAFDLASLDEINTELEGMGLSLTRAQKQQAKDWQNEHFDGGPYKSWKARPYTGELQ